jgi:L-ascorbate oxidase
MAALQGTTNRLTFLALAFLALLHSCLALTAHHPRALPGDDDWEPEYVLVATAQNITINCESRYSVVLNGTSPGPVLRLQEGKTTWIRVYNHVDDLNTTVVRSTFM